MQTVDTLIHARWVVPVEPDNTVLEHHSLAIHDGRITAILPTTEAKSAYQGHTEHQLESHALIPGLVNIHTHASMSLMRGMADDLPLMDWLQNHIWPAEGKWVNPDFVQDGTELAIAEMLKGGTTCFQEMYFFPDVVGRVANKAGMRACIGLIVIDFPTAWAQDADEYFRKGIAVHDQFRSNSLITTSFSPHAPYTVSDEPLQRIRTYAEELDIPVHMHVHEIADEVNRAVEETGKRPLQRLQELGLVSPRLIAVHMTQLTDDEIALLAESGSHVAHCPESNLKLASGFCPVHKLMQAGVNVALGTDGAASNNDLDMFSEMHTAAQLAKAVAGDATALPAASALRMATLNGARALGLDQEIGSLELGKAADVIAVDLGQLQTQPVYNPISQLVYAAGREQVTDVWVAGRHLLKRGQLTSLNEDEILAKAEAWRARMDEAHD
jgi:5-methylthioadenosine/S-adenosylhomocysteine deaminase